MRLLVTFIAFLYLSQHAAAFPWFRFGREVKKSREVSTFEELEDRSLLCKVDAILLACKGLGAQATTFCGSYLHIGTSTTTATTIVPTTTTVPSTLTSQTTTTTTTTTTYTTTTSTTTTTSSVSSSFTVFKRAIPAASRPVVIPPILSKFLASQISSACSCLSLKGPTTTSTSTVPLLVTATSTTTFFTTSTSTTVYTTSTTSTAVSTTTSTSTCGALLASCDFESSIDTCCEGLFCSPDANLDGGIGLCI